MDNKKLTEIKTCIDRYQCISFDIFDTLVKRDCYKPTELFRLMEKRINEKFHIESYFAIRRAQAEKRAVEQSRVGEITLGEIYEHLDLQLPAGGIEWIKQQEQEFEYEFCRWNPLMKPVYEYCRSQHKKVILITDMYLPRKCIERILEKLGIRCEALFVSSEVKQRKSRGGLFRYALSRLGLKPEEVFHIGDNRKSDFLMPKLLGMHSIHIPTEAKLNLFIDRKAYKTDSSYADLCAFINAHAATHYWDAIHPSEPSDYFSQAGYEAEGPVLYGFIKWLEDRFRKDGIEKVFFLARDGQLMQEAFAKLRNGIPCEYMYASRRALIVPMLWMDAELEHLEKNMTLPLLITIKALIKKLGLAYQPYYTAFKTMGFDCLKTYNRHELLKNQKFNEIYEQYVKQDVIRNSKEQYDLLLQYLKQIHFKGKTAIVDIGWFGHMQAALEKIIKAANIPADIHGYYLGLTPISSLLGNMQVSGYLFDKGKHEAVAEKEATFNSIVEALFTADHGTTLGYQKENKEIIPVLDAWEYENPKLQGNYTWIRDAQKGALTFIDDVLGSQSGQIILENMYSRAAFLNWIQLGCYPSSRCSDYFGSLHFEDDGVQPLAIQGSGIGYLVSPKKLAHDFVKSAWRVGFLTRSFGAWPGRYMVYKRIRRLAHRVAR